MQIASLSTSGSTLRAEIEGWTFEDAALFERRQLGSHSCPEGAPYHIGATRSPRLPRYYCVLEMIADGWVLLAPPAREEVKREDDGVQIVQWNWWLTRS